MSVDGKLSFNPTETPMNIKTGYLKIALDFTQGKKTDGAIY